MIPQLLINEPPLQILPTLAKTIGLNEAIVLQQVHYWLNPQFNKNFFEERYWVYNTFTQWHQQFQFWSKKTIKRTIANLEESGLLISFVTRGFKRTKYYTLDYDLLKKVSLSVSNIQILDSILLESHEEKNCSEAAEKHGTHSWGQNDPLDRVNLSPTTGSKWPSLIIQRILMRLLQRLLFLLFLLLQAILGFQKPRKKKKKK